MSITNYELYDYEALESLADDVGGAVSCPPWDAPFVYTGLNTDRQVCKARISGFDLWMRNPLVDFGLEMHRNNVSKDEAIRFLKGEVS